jgi:mannosyltransferase
MSSPVGREGAPGILVTERPGPSPHHDGTLARATPPLLAAAVVVVVLGLPRLGRRPLWLDESYTVGATHDLVATWRGSGGTMALYYLLMTPVTQISTDRAWVRLPSLLFAALAVIAVHEVGRLIGGRRMGAMAAGILAMTWAVSRFGIEARSYSLALLLVSLSWLGLVGAVRAPSDTASQGRWWRLFVVATILAPLAHGLAAVQFVSQVAALLLAPDRRRWLRACVPVGAALAVEGMVLFSIGAGEVADWIEPLHGAQMASLLHMLLGRELDLWLISALVVVAAALAVVGFRSRPRPDAWLQVVPVFWAAGGPVVILAISVVRPYAEPRYVLSAVPGVALLVGGLLARLRPARLGVVVWLVVAATLLLDQPRITSTAPEDWPGLVDQLAAEGRDGDRLLTPSKLRPPFDYAWGEDGGRPDLEPLSPTDAIGEVQRFYDVAPGTLRTRLLADPTATVWYVDRDNDRRDEVDALLSDPEIAQSYDAAGPWVFTGELYLVRFEPRGEP